MLASEASGERVRPMTTIPDVSDIGLFFKFLCPKKQVSGVGGLAALAKRDSWQARPRLTLTYHIIGEKEQVSGAGGLAALAKRDYWQARPHLTLTYHIIGI